MTIIRLITNNYLQTLCSLSRSCGETELNIALQNPLPSPTRIPLLSLSLHPGFSLLSPSIPDSAFHSRHSRRSASATFLPLHLGLLPSLPFPSRLGLPSFICCHFSSLHTFSCLHPVYLCTGHTGLYLPPLAGVSPPERLTIPSASLLICHPNGGYKREKTTICRGRSSRRRARESVWIATVDKVPGCHRFNLCGAVGAGPELILTVICDGSISHCLCACRYLTDISLIIVRSNKERLHCKQH